MRFRFLMRLIGWGYDEGFMKIIIMMIVIVMIYLIIFMV